MLHTTKLDDKYLQLFKIDIAFKDIASLFNACSRGLFSF